MKNKQLNRYGLFACLGVLVASVYPLYMGVKVLADMLINGAVMKENYPKYIIPYTPICIALLVGVLLMPVWIKRVRRFALFAGSVVSAAVFFVVEILFEKKGRGFYGAHVSRFGRLANVYVLYRPGRIGWNRDVL